ncbi:MAG TPA: tRNA uracil 4-sulfurtransferase ThiI [Candidatus Binataceae bacterium]|jgi:thiamine biosynthesis protein ThiI|nr:tRNA uracil 4-sulfurtransferase ThiI [Candidatus Binataceae bacterium]
MRYLIGRYHEIALKGQNRWRFTAQLKRNLLEIMGDYRLGAVRSEGPRLFVELPDELDDAVAIERGALLFGLQNFTLSRSVAPDLKAIEREILAAVAGTAAKSFAVRTRRENKRFALNSMQIDREIGAAVKEALGIAVDLEHPELTINIEIFTDRAFFSIGKHAGGGGLPLGISGRAVALLSGGIDSPVAAYRMMRRGLHLDFVHFHSYPLLSRTSQDKVRELAAHLTRYQGRAKLFLVPFGMLQREIVARVRRPLRVVLYRRFMLRIAGAIGAQIGAQAMVTGESLGQVASQTLDNMTVIERTASLPIMRPLVGMDKNEIVEQARRLDTFETSIIPDQDCCTLFIPRHPETHARPDEVEAAEAALDVQRMVTEAVSGAERVDLIFPPRKAPPAACDAR